ncbi:MAG: DUF4405 domain-containing protein [Pirellulaceae bacterium]|nr:DUF4405 domain-containing protein [Pirellulaceae bacterium]
MSKTILNFWLDCLLLVVFLTLVWVSVILRFVFPAATVAEGWTLWGWTYLQWSGFQFGVLCVMVLCVLLHVMLHWSWVCGVVVTRLLPRGDKKARDDGSWTLYGVGLLIVLLNLMGLAIAAAALTIRNPIG